MEKESTGAIIKALQILEAFLREQDSEIGISRLADLTGLKVSTVHRIASILVDKGYIKQRENRAKYSLGLKHLEFYKALNKNLKIKEIALPSLEKLRIVSGESANLAVLDSNDAVYIEHIESNQTLRAFTEVGNRAPLHCTGVGKIFLAYMSKQQLYNFFSNKSLIRLTDNTITDSDELAKELSIIQRDGVALDNGEMDIGVRCIASPVMDSNGNVIAAMSISGPYTRLNSKRAEELKPVVKSAAIEASKAMGYVG